MAIIKCSECKNEISDKAESCPHCGNVIGPRLIEQTSRRWKKTKLLSWIIFLLGIFIFLSGYGDGGFQNPFTGLGFTLAFVGFLSLVVSRFGIWWHHK